MPERSILDRHSVPVIVCAGIFFLLILILAWAPRSTSLPTRSNYQPTLPPAQPSPAEPAGNSGASQIFANLTPNGTFDTLVENQLYPNERPELAAEVEQAFEYVSQRFGASPSARFKAAFAIDQQCMLHGITRADERIAQVYSCSNIPRAQAVAIMAHEFGHQLEYDYYGPQHLNADQMLAEGLATWAADRYWLGSHPDFRSYVREQRQAGGLSPLAAGIGREDFVAMNRLYYQWASFVDFLIASYGRPQFDKLYITGHLAAGSADYAGIYGKDLNALEQEWQAWLDS